MKLKVPPLIAFLFISILADKDQEKLLLLRQQLITQHFVLIGNGIGEICNRIVKNLDINELKQP